MVAIRKCTKCGGSGAVLQADAGALDPVKCPRCDGTGRMVVNPPKLPNSSSPQKKRLPE
jgi:DnaJ-class molecular chaperone